MSPMDSYIEINDPESLADFCRQLAGCDSIALDTEFVSEHTYRPELCLVQVNADGRLAIIDAIAVKDVAPFWKVVAAPGHETIIHAGRGELEFCLQAVDKPLANMFDVQIAAGLIGIEYPAGYSTLLSKLLDLPAKKHETRTDWRRRPLSQRQIQYALDDVRYLPEIRSTIGQRLEQLDRLSWLEEEMQTFADEVGQAATQERWRRISGNSGLSARSLAVVRELWRWRDKEARRRNCPPRRVLRDDLIVELARRQTADEKRIKAVRGMERGDLKKRMPAIADCVRRAIELPEQECPKQIRRAPMPQLSVLGQFLFSALGSICRQTSLSPGLVGTPSDVRELIAYRNGRKLAPDQLPPRLSCGWRAEVVGHLFDDLLAGRKAIRIADPDSEHPLVFESIPGVQSEPEA